MMNKKHVLTWILTVALFGPGLAVPAQSASDDEEESASAEYSQCVNQYIGPLGKEEDISPREVAIAAYQRCGEAFDAYADALIDNLEQKMDIKDEWRKYITRTIVKQNLRENSLDYITDTIVEYRQD